MDSDVKTSKSKAFKITVGLVVLLLVPLLYISYQVFYIDRPVATVVQNEELKISNDPEELSILKIGEFKQLDPIHYANGQAVIHIDKSKKPILTLKNFSTPNGPDLLVYLSKERDLDSINDSPGEFVSLGKLKSINGEQQYALPEDFEDYNSVLIWCRAFSVLFSSADFN